MCLSRVVIAFEDDVVDVHRSFVLFFYENWDKAAYDIYLIPVNRFLCS